MSSCQDWVGTNGPVYLEGRDTLRLAPRKGIPLRLRTRLAFCWSAHCWPRGMV